jgi:hypothetical protein
MGMNIHRPYKRCQAYLFIRRLDSYPHIHTPYDYDELKILYLLYVNRFTTSFTNFASLM